MSSISRLRWLYGPTRDMLLQKVMSTSTPVPHASSGMWMPISSSQLAPTTSSSVLLLLAAIGTSAITTMAAEKIDHSKSTMQQQQQQHQRICMNFRDEAIPWIPLLFYNNLRQYSLHWTARSKSSYYTYCDSTAATTATETFISAKGMDGDTATRTKIPSKFGHDATNTNTNQSRRPTVFTATTANDSSHTSTTNRNPSRIQRHVRM
jgi:hypothetical protein